MTEGIEHDRGKRNIGLWIVGGIALVAIIWILVEVFDRDHSEVSGGPPAGQAAVHTAAPFAQSDAATLTGVDTAHKVDGFVRFAQASTAADAAAPDHAYTGRGIRLIADALSALAGREGASGNEMARRIETLSRRADDLQADPKSSEHAAMAREAFLAAADGMASLKAGQSLEAGRLITEIRRSAEAIDAKRPLLEQTAQIDEFFRRSAEVLSLMVGSASPSLAGSGVQDARAP